MGGAGAPLANPQGDEYENEVSVQANVGLNDVKRSGRN
jgi:hypothetical protein